MASRLRLPFTKERLREFVLTADVLDDGGWHHIVVHRVPVGRRSWWQRMRVDGRWLGAWRMTKGPWR